MTCTVGWFGGWRLAISSRVCIGAGTARRIGMDGMSAVNRLQRACIFARLRRGILGRVAGCWSVSRGVIGLRDADLRPLRCSSSPFTLATDKTCKKKRLVRSAHPTENRRGFLESCES